MTSPDAAERDSADRVRRILQELARDGRTLTYQALAERAAVPPPHRIHKLTLLLEEMMRADHAAGRPLLAALVVSRAGAGIPGPGFFQLLGELGRYTGSDRGPEAEAAHRAEAERAWAAPTAAARS